MTSLVISEPVTGLFTSVLLKPFVEAPGLCGKRVIGPNNLEVIHNNVGGDMNLGWQRLAGHAPS